MLVSPRHAKGWRAARAVGAAARRRQSRVPIRASLLPTRLRRGPRRGRLPGRSRLGLRKVRGSG
jgi:hypothetical protein